MVELAQRAEQLLIVKVIRAGIINMIPVIIIGAFALVFKSFPVAGYQSFIGSFADGFLVYFFNLIVSATFGVLAVYMTFFVSRSYMNFKADPDAPLVGAIASSLIAFFILAGADAEGFGLDSLGAKSMFLAILTGLGASTLYLKFYRSLKSGPRDIMTRGADREFNMMLAALGPIALVTIIFALADALIVRLFNVDSFHHLMILAFNGLFSGGGGPTFTKGFCFVLLSSMLWFFGIHGSDTLESVMQEYFTPGLEANQAAVATGMEPTHILTKQFFDCFVLMGGCGATICLLIAILVFSRNRSRRELGAVAALPMIFNINELMVFGLPIIYNPIMLIPFLLTPLVCYCTAYLALSMGLVPLITGNVEWTTPILIGGYHATGSMAGSILQLCNVVIGVAIYMPFVRALDKQAERETLRVFDDFMKYFKSHESELGAVNLLDQQNVYSEFARNLVSELRHDMHKSIVLYYQPQYLYSGELAGLEALLRWEHPVFGMLYPPLVIKLAEDADSLADLEEEILLKLIDDRPAVKEKFGNVKVSFNVTGATVSTERFIQFCRQLNARDPFENMNICVEVTEQTAIEFDDDTLGKLHELRSMGLKLAIDDFSMGHTSINYLQNDLFDIIKLDGSLVKGLSTNSNCREIVSSISRLAASLHMMVIAEYVETEEQREMLHAIGCDCYQGWLYSPALPLHS